MDRPSCTWENYQIIKVANIQIIKSPLSLLGPDIKNSVPPF